MRKWKLLARGWSVLGRKIGLPLFLLVVGAGLVYWQTAQGVNRTWDGGGVDGTCGGAGTANNWSCPANWSSDTAPTASDVAIFDGTSTKDATINANISVAGISINAGYTGTITQSGSFTVTVGSSHYSQAAGTFTGGSGTIDINGTFTLSGGTFTSTSGTLEVGRNAATSETTFTVSSGTFNHNSGTVKFAPSKTCNDCGTHTYTVDVSTTLTLYNINISATNSGNSAIVVTTGSGDTVIAVNNFTHTDGVVSGVWEVQNNVIIDSTADGGAGTVTMTGTGSKTYTYTAGGAGPHLRVNNGALSVSAQGGTTSLATHLFSLLAGTFTAPTGTFTIGRDSGAVSETIFTISSGTFSHNSGTVKFSPRKSCNDCGSPTFTIDVPTTLTFYSIEINPVNTGNTNMTVAPGTGDTVVAANNFTHTDGILNGTWEVQGNYTVATTADGGSAPITFTGGNAQVYTDSGGNESDGDVLVNKSAGTVTLASNADWNATSQDVTITGGTLASATYNITTVNFTVNGGTFTGGSGTVTTSGPIAVSSGTFTGGAGNVTVNTNSGLTLSGGTFTAPSGTFQIGVGGSGIGAATVITVSSGTFNHNNGTMKFVSGSDNTHSYTIDVPTSLTFYNLEWDTGYNQPCYLNPGTGDTIYVANDITITDGRLIGAWEVQGNVIIGSGADSLGTGTLTMTGTGSKTYTHSAGGTGPHLIINNAALSVSANAGTTSLSMTFFTLLAGTFTAPSGTFSVGRGYMSIPSETFFTISGGTFNHNNGTINFVPGSDSPAVFTVDVSTSLTLYNIEYNRGYTSGSLTTAAGDTIIATNNFVHTNGALSGTWQVQGNYTVGTGADGGTATINFTGGNNQVYTDQGGSEADGDVTINKTPGSSVRLASNADWNSASQDVTITSGELNMGASYNLSTTALTVSTAGHLSNNGTGDLTLAGNVSNTGNIRFMSSGTCGGTDSISITSSSAGFQRTWSGAGTYLFHDVTVQDQGGSSAITAYSSTSVSGNGGNWTFSGGACPAQPPAVGVPSGIINVQSGPWYVR